MNSYRELLDELHEGVEEANEEIDSLTDEVVDLAKSAGRKDLGACIVACQDLARAYGLRGVFRVLNSDVARGWVDMLFSYRFLAESVRGRSAVRFANGTSLDNDAISELLMASVVFEKYEAKKRILAFVSDPSRYGIPQAEDSQFAMFGNAIGSIIRGKTPSLQASNAFSILLDAGSERAFRDSLLQYEPVRNRLSRVDEDNYQHLENLPIAVFPIEVMAISKLRGWNLSDSHGSLPECFATQLLKPSSRIVDSNTESLVAVHGAFDQFGAYDLSFR